MARRRRHTTTLEARFTLFVVTLLVVFGVFAAVLTLDATQRHAIAEVRADTARAGALQAPAVTASLERHLPLATSAAIALAAREPQVASVTVTDVRGLVIARHVARANASGRLIRIDIPLTTREGAQVGTLSYEAAADEAVAAGVRGLIAPLIGLVLFIAACIPLTMAVVRRATAPLRQLTVFAEQLTAQRLTTQIDIHSGDEFETLALAFNQMVARVNAALRRMQRIAYVDAATELPNGDRLLRDLSTAIETSVSAGAPGALFLISADRISRAIESLGQDAGRDLIVAAAQRLGEAVRQSDPRARDGAGAAPIVARMGACEFAVLYQNLPRGVDVHALARALVGGFAQPFTWREHRIIMPGVAGAAFFPRDGQDVDTLMRHTRLALNAARSEGTNYRFFARALDRAASAKLNLEREMRAALERNEFRAYFQPKINLRNGRVEGAEALARWLRADGSIISPAKFIPAAEEMGLIGPISEAILRDACWKAAGWSREGLPARVAVNVSALQFADEEFPAKVMKIIEQAGLPMQCLELEITESVAMADVDRALRVIEPLKAAGVRFSIDDFGTGHSSLAALTRLPFGVLKIDQSFVRGLSIDRHSAAIIETILAMAAALDYEVVAEGVETEEEAEFLRRRGCPVAQGFLYSAAQPPIEYLRILREGSITPQRNDKPSSALDPAA